MHRHNTQVFSSRNIASLTRHRHSLCPCEGQVAIDGGHRMVPSDWNLHLDFLQMYLRPLQ